MSERSDPSHHGEFYRTHNRQLLEEFYKNGIINIQRMLPARLDQQTISYIESVIFAASGAYRHHTALENILDINTQETGEFAGSDLALRDVFSHAWALVDSLHSVFRLEKFGNIEFPLNLSEETLWFSQRIRDLRNYMDHLPENLRNASSAKSWSPLFGWFTYQFTPQLRNSNFPANRFFVGMLGSSLLKGSYSTMIGKHATFEVIGPIDNSTLHAKKDLSANLSKCFANLTLDLNEWSYKTHMRIVEIAEKPSVSTGGIKRADAKLVVQGDRDDGQPIRFVSFQEPLSKTRARAEIELKE